MTLFGVEFRDAWYLLFALTAFPVFFFAARGTGRIVFSSLELLPDRARSWRSALAWIPDAMLALAAVALSVALAGPRSPDRNTEIKREGIAIMMVVDTSGSMEALDLSEDDRERTRLEAVKDVFEDFVVGRNGLPGRPNDAIGVVSFAGYADTRSPLTLDHDNLMTVLDTIQIVTQRSEDGTALGDGLALAVERLRQSEADSRVAIVLTDGVSNAGIETPLGAAELAKTQGITVHTVGAGTTGVAHIRRGGRLQPTRVNIDEDTLRQIAEHTGGTYFRATDNEGLRDVYGAIDRLERTVLTEQRYREYHEHYGYALGLGLLLAVLALIARGSLFRRLP